MALFYLREASLIIPAFSQKGSGTPSDFKFSIQDFVTIKSDLDEFGGKAPSTIDYEY